MSQSRRALSWWENQWLYSSQTSALLLGCSLHQVLDIKALSPEKALGNVLPTAGCSFYIGYYAVPDSQPGALNIPAPCKYWEKMSIKIIHLEVLPLLPKSVPGPAPGATLSVPALSPVSPLDLPLRVMGAWAEETRTDGEATGDGVRVCQAALEALNLQRPHKNMDMIWSWECLTSAIGSSLCGCGIQGQVSVAMAALGSCWTFPAQRIL